MGSEMCIRDRFKTAGVLCDNNKSNMQKFIQDIDEADREIY